MYADTLLGVEQRHLIGVASWGGLSLLTGALVVLLLRGGGRAARSPLLFHFGAQVALWGGVIGMTALVRYRSISLRDLAGAVGLDRATWFAIGLEVGLSIAGAFLAIASWIGGRRLAGVGSGIAITTHGLALMLLDLRLASAIVR